MYVMSLYRELRNLILEDRRQKEEEQKLQEKMEEDQKMFEKRRATVLQAIVRYTWSHSSIL